MLQMTKGAIARRDAYNAYYLHFVRTLDAAEGIDTAHLVSAHGFAAWNVEHHYALCRCGGTGVFWKKSAGTDANGRPVVLPENCFGCSGKGYQDRADQSRNWGYWSFYVKVAE